MKPWAVLFSVLPFAAFAAEGLPLATGYYVSTGEQCSAANEANVALVHEAGINLPEAWCEFEALSQTGEGEYSFAAVCAHPEQREDYLNEGNITLIGDTGFSYNDGLLTGSFTYCEAASLPANLQ